MTEPAGGVSADFVFGTLATDDLRLARLRADTSGLHHGHDLEPLDPRPGEPIVVRTTIGPTVHADRVTCYVTTDGTDPSGVHGVATAGSADRLPAGRHRLGHAHLGLPGDLVGDDPRSAGRDARALSDRGMVRAFAGFGLGIRDRRRGLR